MIKAALLDERGVYLRVDELASEADLTPQHLPQITYCDLPAGEYVWLPDDAGDYGGAFWPVGWLRQCARDRADQQRDLADPRNCAAGARAVLRADVCRLLDDPRACAVLQGD